MQCQAIGLSIKFDRECSIFAPLYKMVSPNVVGCWYAKIALNASLEVY